MGSLDQLAHTGLTKIPRRMQLDVSVNLAAALKQATRIIELGAADESELHSRLAQDQRAYHATITRTVAIRDHRRRGIDTFLNLRQ
jgi:hypothetical protein